MNKLLIVSLIAGFASFGAQAESITGTTTVAAKLNFQVTIPKVLFLQVGTTAATDTVAFDMTNSGASLGNSQAVAGTGGDLSGGSVTVRVMSNAGSQPTLNNTTTELKNTVTGTNISWSEIDVASVAPASAATGYAAATIPHPAFAATSGGGTATNVGQTNTLLKQEGKWTFKYKNTTLPLAGTYNGTATYTLAAQ